MGVESDKEDLVSVELTELRQRVAKLEAIEIDREKKKQKDVESRRTQFRYLALFLTGIPFIFGIILLMLNRPYIIQFFVPENRTCGLPILGAVIVLSIATYPLIRGSLSVIESGRHTLGMLRIVLVVIFLTLPALLLVFLGPAALLLLNNPLGSIK